MKFLDAHNSITLSMSIASRRQMKYKVISFVRIGHKRGRRIPARCEPIRIKSSIAETLSIANVRFEHLASGDSSFRIGHFVSIGETERNDIYKWNTEKKKPYLLF